MWAQSSKVKKMIRDICQSDSIFPYLQNSSVLHTV